MQHTRSHMHHRHTPSPPSSYSSPQAPPKVATLNTSIWSDSSSPNPNTRSTDTSEEGHASKFFSSRASSIGSSHSAGSGSPPGWPARTQPPVIQPQPVLRRPGYPAPTIVSEPSYELQHTSPIAERELHVVLPEAWMEAPHVYQLAHAQNWGIVDVRMQSPGAVIVFATAYGAARAFAQVNGSPEGVAWSTGTRVQAHWAGAVGRANEEEAQSYAARPTGRTTPTGTGSNSSKQLEFSIFVGDLAPETTNADLVAVFRNPLLGLRSDREPRVIRPFTSCRSAKIMVSPETGISKGYGFVRFTDEADQQRALIEMQGLYCLSRPMRLSHATAKSKPNTVGPNVGNGGYEDVDPYILSRAGAHLLNSGPDTFSRLSRHSVSGPDSYAPRMDMGPPRSRSVDAEDLLGGLGVEAGRVLGMEGSRALLNSDSTARNGSLSEGARLESARALLGVLNSADPYNTTVFVGGLSGLIAEETLRGFFAPFGEIHYVKIPPGKGCGFVQFVRKADAERAIERMQGFPIGGGKIRLSWGRSQSDKAAQAAAQAAQLGLNLGGLHLNSLSAADSARLFQALEALGYSSVPGNTKSGAGLQQQGGNNFQVQQGTNNYPSPPNMNNFVAPSFYEQGYGGQQNGFQMSQQPFSPTQPPFVTDGATSPSGSMSPQQGSFGKSQQASFGQSAQQFGPVSQQSLYEPSSAGLSRAYTTLGSSFQPFSESTSFGRSASVSVPMGHSASATAHLATQPYSTRQSLAFDSETFGLSGRERQLTAPAHSGSAGPSYNLKNLNLGLAGMNLSQRREFGLDNGPLSAPLRNNSNVNCINGGGMKPSASDNNVYIH